MSQFYVGQKVVCVKTHSHGVTRKGVMYVVNAITTCVCGETLVDVGVIIDGPRPGGTICRCSHVTYGMVWWQYACNFRPTADVLFEQLDRIESEPIEEHVEEKI